MVAFFEWLYGLSTFWRISFLAFVLIIAIGTPYFREIGLFIKFLFLNKKLKITNYGYRLIDDYEIGVDPLGRPVFIDCSENDFVIEGGKVTLFWYGEGIIWSKLKPYHKRLSGNMAEVKVTKENFIFEVKVFGFFNKKLLKIEVPKEKIVTLNLKEIVDENVGIRKMPKVNIMELSKSRQNRFELTTFNPRSDIRFSRYSSLISESNAHSGIQSYISDFSERENTVMKYEFSTKKYTTLNKNKEEK